MSYKNQIITIACEKLVFPGRSLCKCDDGLVLFTDGLLPEEIARVFVTKDKKSFREGFVKEIISKSDKRIEPICPIFNKCGGCNFQNTDYESQLHYKYQYLCEALSFINVDISPILKNPNIYHYRNKMEFSFFNNAESGKVDLGLHRKGNFDKYVPIEFCFIADKDFSDILNKVRDFANKSNLAAYDNKTHNGFFRHLVLRKAQNNNQLLVNIVTNSIESEEDIFKPLIMSLSDLVQSFYWTCNARKSDAVICDEVKLLFGLPNIVEKLIVGDRAYFFNVSPFSFFQTNSAGAQILYNEALKLLKPNPDDVLLDLYCGIGAIGIAMSSKVKKAIGVEQIKQAIADAKINAALNKTDNIEFFDSPAGDWIKSANQKFDLIIIDPPRNGLDKNIIEFLINSKARKIEYISCNPSTLARDLHLIIDSGKYKVRNIVPVDMFSHTYHIETIVLLELK
jgi:23S rRNA (uracil-5-)-methyltransferase RumA